MKRLFLALLLLGLATLVIPGLRERAEPHIEERREWLGQKLEGPLSPVLTPYRRIRTEARMGEAARLLVRNRNRGQQPPTPGSFTEFLRTHELEPLDGWGSPMILEQEPDSIALLSPGADLEYHTDDDIVSKLRYAAPDTRFRRRR